MSLDKKTIVGLLETAFDTNGKSIQKYLGTYMYTEIMETKISVKLDGSFEYPTLNAAITQKIQGRDIIYLNPKPAVAAEAKVVIEEETEEEKLVEPILPQEKEVDLPVVPEPEVKEETQLVVPEVKEIVAQFPKQVMKK